MTNLPHTDFDLCKSLLPLDFLDSNPTVKNILEMAELLETCKFKQFWERVKQEVRSRTLHKMINFSRMGSSQTIHFSRFNTVPAGFCDHPPSEGLRSPKPARPLYQGSLISKWYFLYIEYWLYRPHAGYSDHYGRYLLQKKQILRSLYPRSLFMY